MPTYWNPHSILDLHPLSPGFTCTTPVIPKKKKGQPHEPQRRCQQTMLSHSCKSQANTALDIIAQIDVVSEGVSEGVKQALVRIAELTSCPRLHKEPAKSKAREVASAWAAEIQAFVTSERLARRAALAERGRRMGFEQEMGGQRSRVPPAPPVLHPEVPDGRYDVERPARRSGRDRAQALDRPDIPHGQLQQQYSPPPALRNEQPRFDRAEAVLAAEAAERRHLQIQADRERFELRDRILRPYPVPVPAAAPRPEIRYEYEPQIQNRYHDIRPQLVDRPADGHRDRPELMAARRPQAEYEAQIHALQERVRQLELERGPIDPRQEPQAPAPEPRIAPMPIHRHRYEGLFEPRQHPPAPEPEFAPVLQHYAGLFEPRQQPPALEPQVAPAPLHLHRNAAPHQQPAGALIEPRVFYNHLQPQPLALPPAPHHLPPLHPRVPVPVPAPARPYIPQRKTISECFACYDDFEDGDDIIWCEKQCGQNIHRACFEKWNELNEIGARRCAHCRAPWIEQP
ncbi:hypothetical protein VTL71DRAFT_3366 [Oculimacula yallundae]|uniref:RING-type domain-containing protein n=1 Tax=Oculimacula yallundae TaxID=86028 RepID=A0ABR4C6Y0_9HELO